MGFEITQNGTSIKILPVQDGIYENFEKVRLEIIRRRKILVIEDINIFIDGKTYRVPNGLDKILSGLSFEEFIDGIKSDGELEAYIERRKLEDIKAHQHSEELLKNAKNSGDWENVPESVLNVAISNIILTSSIFVAKHEIIEEVDFISYECVYGMNVLVDLSSAIRDFIGGRNKSVEIELRKARIEAMKGLQKEALILGADGVIAIDLDYSELGGKNGMLIVIASGTAVRLKEKSV